MPAPTSERIGFFTIHTVDSGYVIGDGTGRTVTDTNIVLDGRNVYVTAVVAAYLRTKIPR